MTTPSPMPCPPLAGLILAGGAASRLGGQDKAWLPWRGRSLLEHTLSRLQAQVGPLWVSANRNPERYRPWLDAGHLQGVIADDLPDCPGPLAGLASALPRITATASCDWVLVVPVDTPLLPQDLGQQLWQGLQQAGGTARLAVARQGGQTHWLHLLVHVSAAADLAQRLADGERRVQDWCRAHAAVIVDIAAADADFANLNRPEDFA